MRSRVGRWSVSSVFGSSVSRSSVFRSLAFRTAMCVVSLACLAAIGTALQVAAMAAMQETRFPHEEHQGLFPVCSGCHQGVESGDLDALYPPPSQCAGCHDGVDQEEVAWTGPGTRVSNVEFDHVEHRAELVAAGDPVVTCEGCHSDPQGGRMSVDDAEQLDTCWSCHAHARPDHFAAISTGAPGPPGEPVATSACEACHLPLAESGFGRARLQALPRPAGHDDPTFLAGPGVAGHADGVRQDLARCATCHTQDRCVACHVSPAVDEILAMPAAPPAMDQPEWGSEYPRPATHGAAEWLTTHAPGTDGPLECSTCHTSDDCASCHLEPMPDVVAALPARAETRAPGTMLQTHAPATHRSPFFTTTHATLAAAEPSTCSTCHTETYCVDCHDGPPGGGYHEPRFVARHQAEAFGRAEECATCHSTAAFCRECHQESGLGSTGRLGAGYHDAEPLWLLRHGQAARQSLESCASCHQQRDCVQCHGALGAFKVSPHTEDFDAAAAWARSPRTCLACHISNPLGGVGS